MKSGIAKIKVIGILLGNTMNKEVKEIKIKDFGEVISVDETL
jgi:hypothetical protein